MIIGGNGDSIYTRLMTAVGRADMGADNPRYQSNTDRCQHEKEIYEVRRSHAPWSLAVAGQATWLLRECSCRHLLPALLELHQQPALAKVRLCHSLSPASPA